MDGRTLPFVQYLATMAVVRAIKDLAFGDVDVAIKWPNDLYGQQKKLGGVLCNSSWVMETRTFTTVIGIGVNVGNRTPTTCVHELQEQAIGVENISYISKEELLARILFCYECFEDKFMSSGFQALEDQYTSYWLHSNQKVTLEEEGPSGKSRIPMTIRGLTPSGYLLATDENGSSYELHPDGNSLDFFKGLV